MEGSYRRLPKNDEREFRNANCEIQNAELIALEGLDSIEGMKEELEKRTKLFALEIINFVATLSSNRICEVMGRQLLKSGTSVGANYREAGRAESHVGRDVCACRGVDETYRHCGA